MGKLLWKVVSPPTKNLAQDSLVAQQVISDHVQSVGGVLNVVYTKEVKS